jgi:alkanesulfonate monooxygenase SsuD/methylene tetrahydromethanopterin reductase-like flavin-dependent oxidoreductase (luciferase family)
LATFADTALPPNNGADIAGRLEAVGRAAYVSALTGRIGLAPTVHAATTEPFHVAAQLASLDHATHGRAAWVVGGADSADELATIGATPPVPPSEIAEVLEVVRRLWDSWEDDAVIKDTATGRYLDPDKVHHVDFEGISFSVKGPLITPRPPQGQVVVIASESLGLGDGADITLVDGADPDTIRHRASEARHTGSPLVFAEVEVLLDAAEPATKRAAALDRATPWSETARLRHVGSPEALVELLSALAEFVDGVQLHPAVLPVDLPVLAESVLPAVERREPGATLRATLGLPHPDNRFAVSRGRP